MAPKLHSLIAERAGFGEEMPAAQFLVAELAQENRINAS